MTFLDHNSTAIIDEDTLQIMVQAYHDLIGNPSSVHALGRKAKIHYLKAKDRIGFHFGVKSSDIFFVNSATLGLNWLLKHKTYKHIISTDLEHAASFNTLKELEKNGTKVTFLHPGSSAVVTVNQIESALTHETDLVLLGLANSETGIIQNTSLISRYLKDKKIPLYVDAVGLLGKAPFQNDSNVTAYVISSHKIHGPKGIACVIHRNPKELNTFTFGGYQEHSKYAGTENLPSALAFSYALDKCFHDNNYLEAIKIKRDYFEEQLLKNNHVSIIGFNKNRTYNTSCVRFHGISGETLLQLLDHNQIYASHGSACSSGALEPSRVLINMDIPIKEAKECLRFSFSKYTSQQELDYALEIISKILEQIHSKLRI